MNNVANSDFARVTYTEAIEILEKNNDKFEYKVSWGCDLQTEHERYLTEQVYKHSACCYRLPERNQSVLHETK